MKISIKTTILFFFSGLFLTCQADEIQFLPLKNPSSSPSMACAFIFDHYPDVKFCTAIYNKSHSKLHVMRDDGKEIDLDPTITGILFETIELEKRYFTIKSDTSSKFIVLESKNREGIKCIDDKNNIENSFICEHWT